MSMSSPLEDAMRGIRKLNVGKATPAGQPLTAITEVGFSSAALIAQLRAGLADAERRVEYLRRRAESAERLSDTYQRERDDALTALRVMRGLA